MIRPNDQHGGEIGAFDLLGKNWRYRTRRTDALLVRSRRAFASRTDRAKIGIALVAFPRGRRAIFPKHAIQPGTVLADTRVAVSSFAPWRTKLPLNNEAFGGVVSNLAYQPEFTLAMGAPVQLLCPLSRGYDMHSAGQAPPHMGPGSGRRNGAYPYPDQDHLHLNPHHQCFRE